MACLGDIFAVQQRHELGIPIEHVDGGLHEIANPRRGVAVLDLEVALVLANRRIHRLENGSEQPILAVVVVIDHVLAAAISRGDLVDTSPSDALRSELVHRSGEDFLPRQLRIARDRSVAGRSGPGRRFPGAAFRR